MNTREANRELKWLRTFLRNLETKPVCKPDRLPGSARYFRRRVEEILAYLKTAKPEGQ